MPKREAAVRCNRATNPKALRIKRMLERGMRADGTREGTPTQAERGVA